MILIGSPNHMGGPTRGIKGFIDRLGKFQLKKMFAVFDTYMGRDYEKAVRKMEKQVREKAPGMERIVPRLSIRVEGMKGPIFENELSKCREFGKEIGVRLKGDESPYG